MRNMIKHNDDFNERLNTLYKNISLTLYSRKGWCWFCVRGELETGIDCYILTPSSSDHRSTSSSSWLGLLNHGSLRAASPQSANWFSRWHLVPQLTPTPTGTPQASVAPGYIIVLHPPASAVSPLIHTGASLDWRLDRGSIYNNTKWSPNYVLNTHIVA